LGHEGPEKDSRIHASLNECLTTGETGENNLFQTRGLEFRRGFKTEGLENVRRLALAVFVGETGQAQNIKSGLAPLGGERRLVVWRERVKEKTNEVCQCPDEIKTRIISSGYCRLLFLTSAFFRQGSYPEWILRPRNGVTPVLKAIALNHYQVVSGWDFAKTKMKDDKQIIGEPKPTRRLVPPGSVLFLELSGDAKSVGDWIDDNWFRCVSDDDEGGPMNPRKDGFGLAVLGSWDGKLLMME
jgi:CRISPR-associated protein Cmr3